MGKTKQESKETAGAEWNDERTRLLIRLLLKHVAGSTSENGIKEQVWQQILESFNQQFKLNWNKDQLHNRYDSLKRDYGIFKQMKNNSGFGWDPDNDTPTATEKVWEAVLKVYSL